MNDFFQKLGWAIIDTETLTFAQEIKLFSQTRRPYAGIFGSGFTNALWSSPGCKVITFVADSFVDGGIEIDLRRRTSSIITGEFFRPTMR